MQQYLVLADDYTDDEALSRRLAVRGAHLARVSVEKTKGLFEVGGAKLNAEGKMVGSMLVISAENETAAWQWLNVDPYVTGKVWEKITVTMFRVANV